MDSLCERADKVPKISALWGICLFHTNVHNIYLHGHSPTTDPLSTQCLTPFHTYHPQHLFPWTYYLIPILCLTMHCLSVDCAFLCPFFFFHSPYCRFCPMCNSVYPSKLLVQCVIFRTKLTIEYASKRMATDQLCGKM